MWSQFRRHNREPLQEPLQCTWRETVVKSKESKVCGCGEIGRRAGFRFQFPQGSEGSSPFIRTNHKIKDLLAVLQFHFLGRFVGFVAYFVAYVWALEPVRTTHKLHPG